jgi:hypothetical protein
MKQSQAITVKEVLVAARWILDNVGWCKGWYAKDAEGVRVWDYCTRSAACYCLMGAVAVVETTPELRNSALDLLAVLVDPVNFASVSIWNDTLDRTKEEVLQIFDQAIKKASQL